MPPKVIGHTVHAVVCQCSVDWRSRLVTAVFPQRQKTPIRLYTRIYKLVYSTWRRSKLLDTGDELAVANSLTNSKMNIGFRNLRDILNAENFDTEECKSLSMLIRHIMCVTKILVCL